MMFGAKRLVGLTLVVCALWAGPAAAQTFSVNTGVDELGENPGNGQCETAPGNGVCTFRRAFWEAARIFESAPSTPPTVVIMLNVPGSTITVGPPWIDALNGPGTLAVVGAGASSTVIEANGVEPFRAGLTRALNLTISGVTIRHAAIAIDQNSGSLRLDHVRVEESSIGLATGAASTTLTACEFVRNSGAIVFHQGNSPTGGVLHVRRSSLRDNRSDDNRSGGAILAGTGTLILEGVSFVNNHATVAGGAIAMSGRSVLRAVNTTFSGNSAGESGGAISLEGESRADLVHVTLVGNRADTNRNGLGVGGAISVGASGAASLSHVVVSGNTAGTFSGGVWTSTPGACSGRLNATGASLFDIVDCTVEGTAPTVASANLGPLQDNGGPTLTHLPLAGSPAIDGGSAGPCRDAAGAVLEPDQRGFRRPSGTICDLGAVEASATAAPKAAPYDLNGDRASDLLWNTPSVRSGGWLMHGASADHIALFPPPADSTWRLLGSADVDGDGRADLIWRHASSGAIGISLMDGLTVREAGVLSPPIPWSWTLAGSADMDADGRADLVWTDRSRGAVAVWLLDGLALKGFLQLPSAAGWVIEGIGDTNGDGTSDLLWRHFNGDMAIWFFSAGALASAARLPNVDAGWTVAAVADLNGDGRADVVWRHYFGQTVAWLMDGSTLADYAVLPTVPPLWWTLAQALDTDGDGRADLIWRGRQDGRNARWRMDGLTIQAVEFLPPVPDLDWQIVK